jgi:bifunctional DNA-binding transcriptional regulator/antitoxin component of YhaV-PrlF toxin-antitoxin module
MVKVQKTPNNQLIITIPKTLAEFKGIDKGTKVIFKDHTKNSLVIEIIKEDKTPEKIKHS